MGQLHLIPDWDNLQATRQQAEKWGAVFEYNDFFKPELLDDKQELYRRILTYRQMDREHSKDTLHGAFFDLCVNSCDRKIVQVSEDRMRQSMEIAEELSVGAVIFHTNLLAGFQVPAYQEEWLNRNEEFYKKLMSDYPGIRIYVENMFDQTPYMLEQLAKRLQGTYFGVCLDVAHGHVTATPMAEWFKVLAPYIRHLHLNDNDGGGDLHWPVGKGTIDWQEYQSLIGKHGIECSVLVEVSDFQAKEKSLQYMKERGLFPFTADNEMAENDTRDI